MSAYLIMIREEPIHDREEYQKYSTLARAASGGEQAKPLIAYGALHAVEGQAPDGVVVMEFADVEEARAWYERDGYQAALPHRRAGADYRVLIVEGL